MATSQHSPAPTTDDPGTTASAGARYEMSPSTSRGPLTGAWWPRTRDLGTELASLVEALDGSLGHVVHATYSPPDWEPGTRVVHYDHGRFKVGNFPEDDTHQVLLNTSTRMVTLMVIPPDTTAARAQGFLTSGSAADNRSSARELLSQN